MSNDPCGAHPVSLTDQAMVARMKRESHERAISAARARQFAHHADQAIGVVTDVEETDDGLVAHGLFERNTVQFLADPSFGFRVVRMGRNELSVAVKPSRRVRFSRWRQRVRKRLAESLGGAALHEDCY